MAKPTYYRPPPGCQPARRDLVDRLLTPLLDGLFPQYCALCGLPALGALPLCAPCRGELEPNTGCCARCALPLPGSADALDAPARLCGACLQRPPPFARVIAPWRYCERLALLVGCWKFHGATWLTPLLADLWQAGAPALPPVDLVVPVPLHWRRQWHRGYNQAELLGRALLAAEPRGAGPRLDTRLVRRRRATPAQSALGADRRAANLAGAFTVRGRCDNLRVAVVDDVLTTGSTAAALARGLLAAGAQRVEVWCVARTPAPGG